jgi:plasmid stabilization system protein ParE
MRIIWSPLSVDRLSEIAEYIAQDNPRAAERWIEEIFTKVEQLKSFPEIGRIVPEINHRKIRELIFFLSWLRGEVGQIHVGLFVPWLYQFSLLLYLPSA